MRGEAGLRSKPCRPGPIPESVSQSGMPRRGHCCNALMQRRPARPRRQLRAGGGKELLVGDGPGALRRRKGATHSSPSRRSARPRPAAPRVPFPIGGASGACELLGREEIVESLALFTCPTLKGVRSGGAYAAVPSATAMLPLSTRPRAVAASPCSICRRAPNGAAGLPGTRPNRPAAPPSSAPKPTAAGQGGMPPLRWRSRRISRPRSAAGKCWPGGAFRPRTRTPVSKGSRSRGGPQCGPGASPRSGGARRWAGAPTPGGARVLPGAAWAHNHARSTGAITCPSLPAP